MAESTDGAQKRIGFLTDCHRVGLFLDRLRGELDDMEGAARMRWLSAAAILVCALSRHDLSPYAHEVRQHPVMAAVGAAVFILLLPFLALLPANVALCETHFFESLRKPARVLLGSRSIGVFALSLSLELAFLGGVVRAFRGKHPSPPVPTVGSNTNEVSPQRLPASDYPPPKHPDGGHFTTRPHSKR